MRGMSDETLYDKRLIERHIRQGLLTREEVDKRADKIDDLAEQADSIDIDQMIEELQSSGRRRQFKAKTPSEPPRREPRDSDED
jgi:hypothetical protein